MVNLEVALVNNTGSKPAASGKRKAARRRRRQRRKNQASQGFTGTHNLPVGVAVSPVAGPIAHSTRSKQPLLYKMMNAEKNLADYTIGFLERHLDACGEYRTALDFGKVPDGTLPQSVSGQFRGAFTIRHPGADPMNVPLDGRMWSLLILSLPTWRHSFLLIGDLVRPEVTQAGINVVLEEVNNKINIDGATWPNWSTTPLEGLYWSVVGWDAISSAPPPTDLGVSPFIEDFRITGEGFTFQHNTPSLINQGVVVAAQFNPNTEFRDVTGEITGGKLSANLRMEITNIGAAINVIVGRLPGVVDYPWVVSTTMPAEEGAISPTLEVISRVTTPEGVLLYDVGDLLRFTRITVATWLLQRQVAGAGPWEEVIPGVNINDALTTYVRIIEDDVSVSRVNCLTVPPFSQQGMMQQTSKTVQFLLKEYNGIYVVKRVWQPVMTMTSASSYAPLRFINRDTTATSISTSIGQFNDTFDTNYGIAVLNCTSLPLACAPYIKVIRSWEAVPSEGSPWGPFTTGTPPKDDLALVIAKTVADLDPFAYPLDYNGFGLLFGKIVAIVNKIPKVLQTAANVANVVAEVCTSVQAGITASDKMTEAARGFSRMSVVQ